MKTFSSLVVSLGALATFSVATPARAEVILSTDFDGRTVSGATASNLNWITNGVSDPGDLTADFSLFNTLSTQNLFAVQRNLHNQGPWTVDIPLLVGSNSIDLGDITLDGYIFNNSGASQAVSRDFDLTLDLLDSSQTAIIASDSVNDLFQNSNSVPNPSPVPFVFDLSGNILQSGTQYFLRLTASGQGPGNNAGIDNFVVNGELLPDVDVEAVPEPATILGTAVAFGYARNLRKRLVKKQS